MYNSFTDLPLSPLSHVRLHRETVCNISFYVSILYIFVHLGRKPLVSHYVHESFQESNFKCKAIELKAAMLGSLIRLSCGRSELA
jgi:hypothetical protein